MVTSVPIGICDPSPIYARGLAALLRQASLLPVEVGDPSIWVTSSSRNRTLVFTAEGATGIVRLRALLECRPDLCLIALLPDLGTRHVVAAVRAGATGVAAREALPDRLVTTIHHAIAGDMLLPASLGHDLVSAPSMWYEQETRLTPAEARWVRALALGQAVGRIAKDSGLSERTMYRRLAEVFDRIGVTSRGEASAWAWKNGYLAEADGASISTKDMLTIELSGSVTADTQG